MKIKKLLIVLVCLLTSLMPVKIMAQENNNRFDSWKTSAIITPEAKELKPAGNIDVAFKQFAVDDIVIDHYDIYIDGQKVNVVFADGKDILKTSIYLTKTDYYQLQVVAVTKDNHEFSSNIRKFQVCKKGLNIDDKAVNAPVANMQESWYYNWSYTPSTNVTGSKEFVPMIWDENSLSWLESDQVANYTTILGFNEPDLTNQANLSVLQAASYQDLFTETGLRIGSPATSYPTNEWYQEYGKTVATVEKYAHFVFTYRQTGECVLQCTQETTPRRRAARSGRKV